MGRFLRDIGQGFFKPISFINLGTNGPTIVNNEFFGLPAGSVIWLNVGGTWKQATPFIKVGGTWKQASSFIKIAGSWRPQQGYTFLLDEFPGAEVGFSLRKLRSDYTGSAIRIRRSSDNAEQDIGFVNNVLDEAAIMSFCGFLDEAFVTTWYDQVGSKNFVQTVALDQPYIKVSSATTTIQIKEKPAMFISGDNSGFVIASGQTLNFAETNYNTTVGAGVSIQASSLYGPNYYFILDTQNADIRFLGSLFQEIGSAFFPSIYNQGTEQRFIMTGLNRGFGVDRLRVFLNGNASTSIFYTTPTLSDNSITGIGSLYSSGCYLQEIVFYNINKETDRVSIETNMNDFYKTY